MNSMTAPQVEVLAALITAYQHNAYDTVDTTEVAAQTGPSDNVSYWSWCRNGGSTCWTAQRVNEVLEGLEDAGFAEEAGVDEAKGWPTWEPTEDGMDIADLAMPRVRAKDLDFQAPTF